MNLVLVSQLSQIFHYSNRKLTYTVVKPYMLHLNGLSNLWFLSFPHYIANKNNKTIPAVTKRQQVRITHLDNWVLQEHASTHQQQEMSKARFCFMLPGVATTRKQCTELLVYGSCFGLFVYCQRYPFNFAIVLKRSKTLTVLVWHQNQLTVNAWAPRAFRKWWWNRAVEEQGAQKGLRHQGMQQKQLSC